MSTNSKADNRIKSRADDSEVRLAPEVVLHKWLAWSELAVIPRITLRQFRASLRRHRRSTLLMACSRLGVLFNFGPEGQTTAESGPTAYYIRQLFPQRLARQVQHYANDGRAIFFQGQVRFLAAEILRLPTDSEDTFTDTHDTDMGPLLLMAGELLYVPYKKHADRLDEMVNTICTFLPLYEIDTVIEPVANYLRFYIFLTVNVGRLPTHKRDLFDLPNLFESKFGFSVETYSEFIFCFVMHAMMLRNKMKTEVGIPGGLSVNNFRHTTVPHAEIGKMFETVSFSLESLDKARDQLGYGDFDALRDQPYLRHEDVLFCLDYEFAASKLESAVLWRMLRSFKSNRQKDLYLSFWGYVFEDYVAWLFENYASAPLNCSFANPRYQNGNANEICDGIVICGETAILIETKLATCPSATRYSGDVEAMRAYLDQKLVVDKGISQLVQALANIAAQSQSGLPTFLRGIKKFIPLIVTKDDIGSSWGVNAYLNERFQELRGRHKRLTITPLVSMNIATLERLMGHLQQTALQEILQDRIKGDPDLARSFDHASKYVHPGMGRGLSEHMKVLQQVSDKVIRDFGMIDTID